MIESKPPPLSLAHRVLALPRRDLALCGVAVWLVIAFVPFFYEQRYTSRAIVYAVVLPFGLVALWRLVAQRNPAAMAGAAFLAWALLSSLSAEARWLSILPAMNRQENLFTYAAVFGLWALSRTMSARGAIALGWAFVGAVAVNGLLGVAQVVFGIENGPLSSAFGRATGFSTNPVYFGAVSCGLAAWFAWQLAGTTGMRLATAGTGVASGAALVTLSGSRVALASLLLVVAALSVVVRTRRQVAGLAFTVAGIVIGTVIGSIGAGARTAGGRLGSGGLSDRLHIWGYGVRAFGERPVQGYGLGRFRPAIQSRFTPSVIRDAGVGDLDGAWFDSHNIVVQLLVGVGVVGTALFVLFVVLAGRHASGPLAWGSAAIAVTWSLQPSGHVTLGVVALLFGASQVTDVIPGSRHTPALETSQRRRVLVATSLVGFVIGSWVVAADLSLKLAEADRTVAASSLVARLAPHDPIALSQAATFVFNPADPNAAVQDEVLDWSRQAATAEPDFPFWWASLGVRQLIYGDEVGAMRSFERALELQPYHEVSLRNLALIAQRTGDTELEEFTRSRLSELEDV